ncbi:MAG: DUF4118 domain-containing protein [Alistipes sp.]|jgi:two-component system sensor histidine kinase KdpD|nr:DUF4118 domain-containing protein [Alistipes sp.]
MKLDNHRPDRVHIRAAAASIRDGEGVGAKRGKLKIFFGMSSGVGKTLAMLQAAWHDQLRGVDVAVGCADTHDCPDAGAVLKKLKRIPPRIVRRGDPTAGNAETVEEMDLDAVIARHPYLVPVDDLGHVNVAGSRHARRWQDVQELLDHGINVYTTLNMQQLESRCDTSDRPAGMSADDTVPDEMFEAADDVVLVDITPNRLIDRLVDGKVHLPSLSREEIKSYFSRENITARREVSLRLVADKVNRQRSMLSQQESTDDFGDAGLRLMVLFGSDASAERLIRMGKRLSYTMGMELVALHVKNIRGNDPAEIEQLSKNIALAHELGARVIVASGNHLVKTVLHVIRKEKITHMVAGKSKRRCRLSRLLPGRDTVNRLIRAGSDLDWFVAEPLPESMPASSPNSSSESERRPRRAVQQEEPTGFRLLCRQCLLAVVAVSVTALLCLPIADRIGYQSVAFIMLFVVLLLSMFVGFRAILAASVVGALAWGCLFMPPRYTLAFTGLDNILALLTFLAVALVTGALASKFRRQERLAQGLAERTFALFHLTDRLATADGIDEMTAVAKDEINKYFGVTPIILMSDGHGQPAEIPENLSEHDAEILRWVMQHSTKAGRHTDTLNDSEYTFFPLKGVQAGQGVVVVRSDKRFSGEKELIWNIFLTQISNAMEHQCLIRRNRKINLLYESDRLYSTIFNSVSHELRIPVATVMAASDALLAQEYPEEIRRELYSQIFTASNRLNRLIENLLNTSRIESRKIAPHIDWCDVADLFNRVVDELADELKPFRVTIDVPTSMPLVRLDFGLMEQALHNLVYNSCKYAASGTEIGLGAFYDDGDLVIQESDRGPGFPPDMLPRVFDKFRKGDNLTSGGLGLGLSIASGFVKAHGGTIGVENREGGGARFTIKIPTEIAYINNSTTEHDER